MVLTTSAASPLHASVSERAKRLCARPRIDGAPCRGLVRYACTRDTCSLLLCGMHVVREPLRCPVCAAPATVLRPLKLRPARDRVA